MYHWEQKLAKLAYTDSGNPGHSDEIKVDEYTLNHAYEYCDYLIKKHSRTFYLASCLLPMSKRKYIRALYAFCRIIDNIVDIPETDPLEGLKVWKKMALSNSLIENDPVAIAWLDTRIRYGIPLIYAQQLIEGISRDLSLVRYETFDELVEYCYGVASTVGLMAMHIIGFKGPKAIPYAIKLGISIQLSNILRDVSEDWKAGRLYLPLEELKGFNLSEADIQAGKVDHRWRSFMKYQIDRCRKLYAESLPGISMLNPDGRFAIAAAAELYRAILNDIEANDYDVFHRRAYVNSLEKIRILPGIWWRSKTLSY